MPREPSIAESAKQRSLRVPLDYYRRPDRIVRLKLLLSLIAAVAPACYLGWLVFGGQATSGHLSPGPVASVHATWNDDCQACHQSFRPLRAGAVDFVALVKGGAGGRASLDQACLKCHDEPAHHTSAKSGGVPSCAACHHEHQRASADIVRAADHMCLACHRDLRQHCQNPSRLDPDVVSVTGFGTPASSGQLPHPEFRSLKDGDPGNIKFNHWLHLQSGIAVRDSKSKLTLDKLDESQRSRYAAYAKSSEFVQLDCSACHQSQSDGGAYMQPISFEQHCRACHPLQFTLPESQTPLNVPHGLSAERLGVHLDGLILAAEQSRQGQPQPTADESGDLPLVPGKTLGKNLAQKIGRDLLSRRATAARAVAAKCRQCHYERNAAHSVADLPELLPPNIPAVWLRHARFDHRAHRHVEHECRACHVDAYTFEQHDKPKFLAPPPGVAQARDDQQVMIAGRQSCAACHAPKRDNHGGARQDCAECHAYHGRDFHLVQAASQFNSSFPGSPLGTHYAGHPLHGSASASSPAPPIRLAAFTSVASPVPTFVGSASCAASGCHGDARLGMSAWKSAYSTWVTRDPHAQAYDVLWTFRAREMTRLLSPRSLATWLPDADHLQSLKQRCIGCHATPPPQGAEDDVPAYTLGVQCESCHGPASEWLHGHDRTTFSRSSASGFVDTKDLSQRAGACMGCHVGPNEAAGQPQVVDHDLIAAGHPRLTFEFHAYIESLPAHWNRKADEARHAVDFHFRSWLLGEIEQTKQKIVLLENSRPRTDARWTDFALLDCYSCHNPLSPTKEPKQRAVAADAAARLTGFLKPAPISPRVPLPAPRTWDFLRSERIGRVMLLLRLYNKDSTGWDAALHAYLAARASVSDFPSSGFPLANREIVDVGQKLDVLKRCLAEDSFVGVSREMRIATQYDAPSSFSASEFEKYAQELSSSLQALYSTLVQHYPDDGSVRR